eukprot:IDg2605t1
MTSKFQRVMDRILGHIPNFAVYVEDIAIFSTNASDHAELVFEVISRLKKWILPIRILKSSVLCKVARDKDRNAMMRFLRDANHYIQFEIKEKMIKHMIRSHSAGINNVMEDVFSSIQKPTSLANLTLEQLKRDELDPG